MKKIICYLFHERNCGPWKKIGDDGYSKLCMKCLRVRTANNHAICELKRAAVAAVICVVVVIIIGYFLKP